MKYDIWNMKVFDERTQRWRYPSEYERRDMEFWPTVAMIVVPLAYSFIVTFF